MQTLRQKALLNRQANLAKMNAHMRARANSLDDVKTFARIWIDGNEIGGYLTYTALDAKSYFIEPVRSTTGVIENLNSYATFLTPQVTLEFKYMNIATYRLLLKIIYERNEHVVKYYDIVYDKMVTRKMYFKPEQLPTIFQRKLEILAVTDYKVELVGTNAELDAYSITYHLNSPVNTISEITVGSDDFIDGEEIIMGDAENINSIIDNAQVEATGYTFTYWATTPEPVEGEKKYMNDWAYVLNSTAADNYVYHFYARWIENYEYILTYNYGVADAPIDSSTGQPLYNKKIHYGDVYGEFPVVETPKGEYNGEEIDGVYSNGAWYRSPQKTPSSVALQPSDIYEIKGDSVIYLIYDVSEYDLILNPNDGTPSHGYKYIHAKYGDAITAPIDPKREGYTFDGWWTTEDFQEGTKFIFNTMPCINLMLWAKWVKNEE